MFTSRNIAVEDEVTVEYAIHQLHFPSLHLNCFTNSLLMFRQNSGLQKVFTPLVFSVFTCRFLFSVLPAVLGSLLAVFFGLLLVCLLSFTTSTFHDAIPLRFIPAHAPSQAHAELMCRRVEQASVSSPGLWCSRPFTALGSKALENVLCYWFLAVIHQMCVKIRKEVFRYTSLGIDHLNFHRTSLHPRN